MGARLRAGVEAGLTRAIHVRRAEDEDLGAVVEIEHESFGQPWRRETFVALMGRPSVDVLVGEVGEVVVGYVVLRSTVGESELANLAVAEAHRRTGVARALLTKAVETAQGRGATWVFLAVRASNREAARLYERFGFQEIGTHGAYYQEPLEDARVFALEFPAGSGP